MYSFPSSALCRLYTWRCFVCESLELPGAAEAFRVSGMLWNCISSSGGTGSLEQTAAKNSSSLLYALHRECPPASHQCIEMQRDKAGTLGFKYGFNFRLQKIRCKKMQPYLRGCAQWYASELKSLQCSFSSELPVMQTEALPE